MILISIMACVKQPKGKALVFYHERVAIVTIPSSFYPMWDSRREPRMKRWTKVAEVLLDSVFGAKADE